MSLATRLRYFDTIITPVACFAEGHRAKKDLNKIDVTFRKLLRGVVVPPVPQTGHGLGMKSCMSGMHGLYNSIFGETLVSALSGNALEVGAPCSESTA